jgi:hypothetical protein
MKAEPCTNEEILAAQAGSSNSEVIISEQSSEHIQDVGTNSPARRSLVAEANNVRATTPAQYRINATSMGSEELAAYVVKNGWGDVLRKLVQLKPYIEVLWRRFDELKTGQMIAGCRTKDEFSQKCLNRSIRAVQYMLYGRAPAKPKADIVRPGTGTNSSGLDDELIDALMTKGYKKGEAVLLAKVATGSTFQGGSSPPLQAGACLLKRQPRPTMEPASKGCLQIINARSRPRSSVIQCLNPTLAEWRNCVSASAAWRTRTRSRRRLKSSSTAW